MHNQQWVFVLEILSLIGLVYNKLGIGSTPAPCSAFSMRQLLAVIKFTFLSLVGLSRTTPLVKNGRPQLTVARAYWWHNGTNRR